MPKPTPDEIIHNGRKYINIHALAQIWNCGITSIKRWMDEGMPSARLRVPGQPGLFRYFYLPDCQSWYRGETEVAS